MRVDIREVSRPSSGMGFVVAKTENPDQLCFACNVSVTELHKCGMCFACCSCRLCAKCDKIVMLETCNACYLCTKCCKCYSCKFCHSTIPLKDRICKYCGGGLRDACGCCRHLGNRRSNHYRKALDVNLLRYVAPHAKDRKHNPSPRLLSAEMEVCGIDYNKLAPLEEAMAAWHCGVVGDGSLPETGFEINTHPAGGDYWVDLIDDVCKALGQAKAWVDHRAGCHIHVDCRDFGYGDLARALRLFGNAEAGLYSLLPPERAQSTRYCTYWCNNYIQAVKTAENKIKADDDERKKTLRYRHALLRKFYGFSDKAHIRSAAGNKGGGQRYRGVNLHSFLYRGTIEFRMPPGMVMANNITNWGMLLANMLDVAKHRSMEEIIEMTAECEALLYPDYIDVSFNGTPQKVKKASIALIQNLAPTTEVRDWIIERIKWAPSVTTYKEAYE